MELTREEAINLLGTDSTDEGVVHRAFREKAKSVHPDKGGSPETFSLLQLACAVVLDKLPKHVDRGMDAFMANYIQVLAKVQDPSTSNIIELLRRQLATNKLVLAEQLRKAEKDLLQFEEVKRRTICKSKDNPIRNYLDTSIRNIRVIMNEYKSKGLDLDAATLIADTYEYRCETRMSINLGNSWSHNG